MSTKLDWSYDQSHDCEVAFHNGYMIKADRGLLRLLDHSLRKDQGRAAPRRAQPVQRYAAGA